MGYTRHHGIFVTTFNKELLLTAYKKADEIFEGQQVSGMTKAPMNGWYSFAIFPDGSNEGWQDSDKGDFHRTQFIAWLETQRYEDGSSPYDFVEVQYGNDSGDNRIINDSGIPPRKNLS